MYRCRCVTCLSLNHHTTHDTGYTYHLLHTIHTTDFYTQTNIEESNRAWWPIQLLNRWLSMRLELTGVVLPVLVVCICVCARGGGVCVFVLHCLCLKLPSHQLLKLLA